MHAVLKADVAGAECGDLLEAYRDTIYPNRGRRRADLWYVLQVAGYVARSHPSDWSSRLTSTLWLLVFGLPFGVVAIAFGGGIILLLTLFGSVVTLLAAPVLWLSGRRRSGRKTLAFLGAYLSLYLTVSTVLALLQSNLANPIAIGQEVCADAGCFAVDKVDKSAANSENVYTLFWHLSSRDKETPRRFPGKGLDVYMFDEHGRKFGLTATDNRNPLDLMLPPGGTVHQTSRFQVPADAHELFLTARYRPFTFQSLLPGELSLVPRPDAKMIRIQ